MKKFNKTWLLLLSLGLVFAFCSTALAGAEFKAVKVQGLSLEEIQTKYAGVEAKPMPLPKLKRPDVAPQGPAPHVGIPLKEFNEPALTPADAQTNSASGGELTPRLGPCPASSYIHIFDTDYTAWPTKAVGKLLFTGIDGQRYMCTGSVINRNLVLTAGHCVMTSGFLHSAFEFSPGWYYGPTVFGTWSVNTVVYFSAWANSEDYRYDVALMVMNPSNGLYVSDVVGGYVGFSAGADPATIVWNEYGYPWNLADGQALSRVTSALGTYDIWQGFPSNPTLGVGSNMQGGSSGGSWLRHQAEYGWQANGLNSYGYTDCDFTMFGPYFGSDIWDMYQYAKSIQ